MVVCVYGSASDSIDSKYVDAVYDLCKYLGENGHSLVFGGGATGLMGAAARGFRDGGGFVHGVIPKFFEENGFEGLFYEANKITRTDSMAERKTTMEDECEVFIVCPGGVGTFEEFFEALTLKQLDRHKKAIVLFNVDGYYDGLVDFYNHAVDCGFINTECRDLYGNCKSKQEVLDYIKNYDVTKIKWNVLKKWKIEPKGK